MNYAADNLRPVATQTGSQIARVLRVEPGQFEYARQIGAAALVGIFGALANLAFRWLINQSTWVFLGLEWQRLGVPLALVLLSGAVPLLVLHHLFPGEVLGYGFPDFLAKLHLGGAQIKRRWIFIKALAAAISLGAGASVGREGPIAQIGGAIGSTVAQAIKLGPSRRKVLVACGAGAAIATTFNAPIGGLLFAQEIILLGDIELASLTLLVIATTSAVVTSHAAAGNAAAFRVGTFEFLSDAELGTYAAMGVFMGFLSAGFIRLFYLTREWFRRLNFPVAVRLGAGLIVVGLIATFLRENLSDGYPVINAALAGRLPPMRMGLLATAKIVAACISLGCGAPGGVFGPIFFIGAMVGGMFRGISTLLAPTLTGPRGSYALVGLGTFLAATTRAPLTAVFLLFEMTRSYTITLPILVSCALALLVSHLLEGESIDTYALALEGKSLQIGHERLMMKQISVADVMTPDAAALPAEAPLAEVLRVAGETPLSSLPVIDRDGNLVGAIVMRDLLTLLATGTDVGRLVNAYDVCRRLSPCVTFDSDVDEALQAMDFDALDELPVVSDRQTRRLIGMVTRQAIAQATSRAAISLSAMSAVGEEIPWSTGYRAIRVIIPAGAAGKTLRELEPRTRFGVSVLAVREAARPADGFILGDPDRPLESGDVIVAAGRPSALRLFQRELEQL
jgi:CIC family chloride channel protein